MPSGFLLFTHLPVPRHTVVQGGVYYANRQYPSYASVAGQAAPLAGVQVAVLDESGVTVARLTTDEAGAAEATNLPAPNASYSLQETNTTVRPYAVYRLRADASGWQSQILHGVQVFDGQQTVARLEFLPGGGDGNALPGREAAPQTVTIPPHVLFAGDGGSRRPQTAHGVGW